MHLVFKQDISVEQVESVFRELGQGRPELYVYHEDSLSPRPGRDLDQFDQRAHIGRVKAGGNSRTLSIVAMGHNLVRGAAGAALRNMEFYRDHHAN
jgi:aspartate-semialdehyde dehydrogenase